VLHLWSENAMVMPPLILICRTVLLFGVLAVPPAGAANLPEPPIAPASAPVGDAPVPNKDAASPYASTDQGVRVTVKNFRHQAESGDPAAGFTPGSRYENSTEQKGIQSPGFLVTVPLKPDR
jgi:hypothetical protein